jgi:DNA-binding response OmpR family regulator
VRLLVVEDEIGLANSLKKGLEAQGFAVDLAHDGTDGLWLAREHDYDAILLDVMLPGVDGYQICRTLRDEHDRTPVIMLTALLDDLDEAEGLDCGADDWVSKPFSHVVLLARLRALLRRGSAESAPVLTVGDLTLDPAARIATLRTKRLDLTSRELSVLEFLVRRQGQVVSKRDVLDHVWDGDFTGDPNIVEVYVSYLRKKLGKDMIQTVRGAGYRLVARRG